ncbi:diacylglycerol/lipid kinase family protein [Euzebya pacifica]|nr:diacylglycerol kinase family protein [Euzebya pacifica]
MASTSSSGGRGYLLVRNTAAGTDDQAFVDAVCHALGTAEVVATDGPGDVDDALRAADGRMVVACGGDGSLHLLVERARALGLADRVELGLVPLGTGNDFAGHLGIPTDPDGAAAVLRDGPTRAMDVLIGDDDQVVVNAVHVGIGVEAARRADDLKASLGALAYPLGAMVAGVAAEGLQVEVRVDGERIDLGDPALMVIVGNGPTIGGGTPAVPSARPDDGVLDVVVSHAVGPAARTAFGMALARGTHVDRDDVVTARGGRVEILGPRLAHNADGDLAEATDTPRSYRIEPASYRLRVPPAP